LRIRRQALSLSPVLPPGALPRGPEFGEHDVPPWAVVTYRGFHNQGVEHRFVAGSFQQPGPATDWIRLRVPLIAGEPTSPLSRVAAAADFGNGISWALERNGGYSFINPDLTIYLHRYPVGEWVCLAAATSAQAHGVGMAESALYDEQGPIGRSVQSLLIEQIGR
jgi:hypothetical protein